MTQSLAEVRSDLRSLEEAVQQQEEEEGRAQSGHHHLVRRLEELLQGVKGRTIRVKNEDLAVN